MGIQEEPKKLLEESCINGQGVPTRLKFPFSALVTEEDLESSVGQEHHGERL